MQHPNLRNKSEENIFRDPNFDIRLTKKKLMKEAREASLAEKENYYGKLRAIGSCPEQLLFLDETSKHGRDALRLYDRSKHGTIAVVRVLFNWRNRVSIIESID